MNETTVIESADIFVIMRQVLYEMSKILFPTSVDPDKIIPQVWRNKQYLGEFERQVPNWRGWSANLGALDNRRGTQLINLQKDLLTR